MSRVVAVSLRAACLLTVVSIWPACPQAVAAQAAPGVQELTQSRIINADREAQNWFTTGRDLAEQHYSLLDQIKEQTVVRLGFAWQQDAGSQGSIVEFKLEATPVVVDGVMYTSAAWGAVYALNAATGRELWHYSPQIDSSSVRFLCCGPVNRGVAVRDGRVYVGQTDGWLVALNASNGRVMWKVNTIIDHKRGYSITGAPRVVGDKVVIGNGGAEFGGVRGYISAFALKSGALRWRFFTVPGDPQKGVEQSELKMAAKTWDSKSNWAEVGGGNVWDGMAYDPALNLLYIGTANGSPTPVWLRSPGRTENLFLSSILAINPDTGRMVWYYQTTPGESWDYDATSPMILADLHINGKKMPVLMDAPKNGFFYVINRISGKLLSAAKFVRVTWASRVDLKTGRPVEVTQASYEHHPEVVLPSPWGGHDAERMAFSRDTGLVYIPVLDVPMRFKTSPHWRYRASSYNWGADIRYEPAPGRSSKQFGIHESLLAWNPVKQRSVWRVSGGGGGVLATAGGLVFQGDATGHLNAYRARDGKLLKSIFIGTGIFAAPMTYAVDGVQYIAVMAGNGKYVHGKTGDYSNRGRVLAFRLDGGPTPLPAVIPPETPYPVPPRPPTSARTLSVGRELFVQHCYRCHSGGLTAQRSEYPNLFNLPPEIHRIFKQIVLQGLMASGGMGSFADLLSDGDVDAIQSWLIDTEYSQRRGKPVPPITWFH